MRYSFFYLFLISRATYVVFNKSHMFIRRNLVADLMYLIYLNDIFGPPMGNVGHFYKAIFSHLFLV